MDYSVVPAKEQEAIKRPQRAAWFEALLDAGMLAMSSRPTLSQAQKQTLEAQGMRFRSRQMNDKMYVWVEDIPAKDLQEAEYAAAGEPDGDVAYLDEPPVDD